VLDFERVQSIGKGFHGRSGWATRRWFLKTVDRQENKETPMRITNFNIPAVIVALIYGDPGKVVCCCGTAV
jgi:hypothetical protein